MKDHPVEMQHPKEGLMSIVFASPETLLGPLGKYFCVI